MATPELVPRYLCTTSDTQTYIPSGKAEMSPEQQRHTNGDNPTNSGFWGFMSSSVTFFRDVLDAIRGNNVLVTLWGLCVLFLVLITTTFVLGGLTAGGRLAVVVLIVLVIASLFVYTIRKAEWPPPAPSTAPDKGELRAKARECLNLLYSIEEANTGVLSLIEGQSGTVWQRLANDNYNRVCSRCEDLRQQRIGSDSYLDTVCSNENVSEVCNRKWYLGERLREYEDIINRQPSLPREHKLVQRNLARVVGTPLSPRQLDQAVRDAIRGLNVALDDSNT